MNSYVVTLCKIKLPAFHYIKLKRSGRPLLVLLALLLLLGVVVAPMQSYAQSGIVLDRLLTNLQSTLIRVNQSISEADLPRLAKATLSLKSALREVHDGKLSLFIIEFGSTVAKHSALELSLHLRPPDASATLPVSVSPDLLSEAIIESARAVKRAQEAEPKLLLHRLTAAVRFVVKSDTESGVSFSILPITASIGEEVSTEEVQEIVLEFGPN